VPTYPEIKPYRTQWIDADEEHRIYVERCGCEGGVPVIFLHGGPGSSTNANHRRYFDPTFFDVVLFDQRGCGQSVPSGLTKSNTTRHLIEDINLIKTTLGITQRVIIFGGSWGSALALAYAAEYGEHVEALVLRGIFLGSREEVRWYTNELRRFMPDAHDQLLWDSSGDLVSHYYDRINSSDRSLANEACCRWNDYEIQSMMLGSDVSHQAREKTREVSEAELARAQIQLHYLKHDCFLASNELLQKAELITNQTVIVQGGMDMICPPLTAYQLHEKLSGSRLRVVGPGGHGAWQTNIANALSEEMELLKKQLQTAHGN
jgi:proline iminopeptidase